MLKEIKTKSMESGDVTGAITAATTTTSSIAKATQTVLEQESKISTTLSAVDSAIASVGSNQASGAVTEISKQVTKSSSASAINGINAVATTQFISESEVRSIVNTAAEAAVTSSTELEEIIAKINVLEALQASNSITVPQMAALAALRERRQVLENAQSSAGSDQTSAAQLAASAATASLNAASTQLGASMASISSTVTPTGSTASAGTSTFSMVTVSASDLTIPKYITATRDLNMYGRNRPCDIDLYNLMALVDTEVEADSDKLKAAIEYIARLI